MARLNRPTGPIVPAHRGAVEGRLRALTPQLVEEPALAVTLIAPLLDKATRIVVGSPLALVVNNAAVGKERTVVLIHCRHFSEGQVVDQDRRRVGWIVRATTKVDYPGF